jgi:hypothetical protein
MAKKSNLQNIKELLDGTHNTQTRAVSGYTKSAEKKREVGEVWYETLPTGTTYRWEQKDGFRVKTAKNSLLTTVKEALSIPATCPACNGDMRDHEQKLHEKMYRIYKTCFSCVLIQERKIKQQGPEAWEEYSKKFMKANAEAWLKDVDREFQILREALTGKKEFVNSDGTIESWDQVDRDKYIEFIDTEYVEFKTKLLEDLS